MSLALGLTATPFKLFVAAQFLASPRRGEAADA